MATPNRDYPEVPGAVSPDVPYYVNAGFRAIDVDVNDISNRVGQRRALLETDSLYDLPQGDYDVLSGTVATALGLPVSRLGVVEVLTNRSMTPLRFTTNHLDDAFPMRVFEIAADNEGAYIPGNWVERTDRDRRGLPKDYAIDTWAGKMKYNGRWKIQAPANVTTAGSKTPTAYTHELIHSTQPETGGLSNQLALGTHVNDSRMYYRAETAAGGKVFGDWHRVAYSEDLDKGVSTIRHQLTFEEMAAMYGGRINTNGAVPVALTFDDYPAAFRDVVMPLLEARGLPCTIGLSSRQYLASSTVVYAGAVGTTWAEIDAWPSWIEVANHSATHGSATTRETIKDEIVTGLTELQAALPSKPIYTFMQPSVTYDPGFNNGDSVNAYSTTWAGKFQLEHHAVVTGTRRPANATTAPATGRPIQGMVRNWLDSSAGITLAQSRVASARGLGHGLILAAHADRFGKTGNATVAELTAFLDWLVAEQTAGRVKVMKLAEWAIADFGPVA